MQVWFLVKQDFITSRNNWHVHKHVVIHCKAHECTYKLEVDVGLEGGTIEPVELDVFIELKHAKCWIKEFAHDKTKVFLTYSALVDSWLFFELDFKWEFKGIMSVYLLHLYNFLQRLFQNSFSADFQDVELCSKSLVKDRPRQKLILGHVPVIFIVLL